MTASEQQSTPPVTAFPKISLEKRFPPLLLAALSGILLIGAFPKLDWGWLAWLALAPFLSAFPHRRMRGAVLSGFVLGFVFFAGLWYWMALFAGHAIGLVLGSVVWLGAALSQSLWIILFAVGAQVLSRKDSVWAWRLGVPALWTVIEWVRQFGTFGTSWGNLGYTQHSTLLVLQITKLIGVFGLSFLIVLVNAAFFTPKPIREPTGGARAYRLAVGGLFLATLLYGTITMHTERLRPTFVAAALQGDVNENVKWTPQYAQQTIETFDALAQQAAAQGAKLAVWPETAFPGYVSRNAGLRSQVAAVAATDHLAMLIGSVDYDPAVQKNANALYLMQPSGLLAGRYWKQKLVPFGEYIPFRKQLPFLSKLHLSIYDMEPGSGHQPVLDAAAPVGKVGAAVCYDSTDNELMRRQVILGADLLVVSTDDTWFGRTAAARQHAAFSAVRAAEEDRYLVRCAATGVSQVISPTGRVLAQAGLFQEKAVMAPVQPRHDLTLYARWGDWFVGVSALGLIVLLLLPGRHSPKQGHQV